MNKEKQIQVGTLLIEDYFSAVEVGDVDVQLSTKACESLAQTYPGQSLSIYVNPEEAEYVLYGYATPSGKLYASSLDALQNGEQSWVKVYVKEEDLK